MASSSRTVLTSLGTGSHVGPHDWLRRNRKEQPSSPITASQGTCIHSQCALAQSYRSNPLLAKSHQRLMTRTKGQGREGPSGLGESAVSGYGGLEPELLCTRLAQSQDLITGLGLAGTNSCDYRRL